MPTVHQRSVTPTASKHPSTGSSQRHLMDPSVGVSIAQQASAPSLLLADGSATWRQYVSLAVCAGVLLDILLGSPLANMALKPMKGDTDTEEGSGSASQPTGSLNKSKERIDSDAVAQSALDKATSSLELRQFLEERKTDWDRMEEIRKKMDADIQNLDEDLEAREKDLSSRKKN